MPYFTDRVYTKPGSYTVNTRYVRGDGSFYMNAVNVYNTMAERVVESRSGTTTPGYHNPNRSGLLPVNNYSYALVKSKYSVGSYTEVVDPVAWSNSQGYTSVAVGHTGNNPSDYPMGVDIEQSVISAAHRHLVVRLLGKVKDQKVNLAQMYAERAQTKATVADALLRLAKAAGAARKGNLAQAARHLGVSPRAPRGQSRQNQLASDWLALQYGWRPLIGDIYGIVEELHRRRQKGPPVQRVRVTTQLRAEGSSSRETSTHSIFGYRTDSLDITMGCTFSAIDGSPTRSLAQLGITNPALLAWELLPWSFVVDWFLPIGNYLELLDATNGVKWEQGFTTTFRKRKMQVQRTYKSIGSRRITGQDTMELESIEVNRSRLPGFPSIPLPSFKDPYSHEHFANAYALFRTNFRK